MSWLHSETYAKSLTYKCHIFLEMLKQDLPISFAGHGLGSLHVKEWRGGQHGGGHGGQQQ